MERGRDIHPNAKTYFTLKGKGELPAGRCIALVDGDIVSEGKDLKTARIGAQWFLFESPALQADIWIYDSIDDDHGPIQRIAANKK